MRQDHADSTRDPSPADAPGLVSDAISQAASLLRNELRLVKREMQSKAVRAVGGIALMIVAFCLVLSALDVLTAAAVAGLAETGLPVSVASLIVGGTAVLLAIVLYLVGRRRVMPDTMTPETTLRNIRKDIATVKESAHV